MSNPHPLPFPKTGAAANPNGRPPKEWTMSSLIREALEEQDENGTPKKLTIARKLAQLAKEGDITAIKEVNNRLDGMPVQKNVLQGDEDKPIQVDINVALDKIYGNKSGGTSNVSDDS